MRVVVRGAAALLAILGLSACLTLPVRLQAQKADSDAAAVTVLGKAAPGTLESGRAEIFRRDFDRIWQTVRDRLYDPKMNGVDWSHIGETYRARLGDVHTKAEFEALVNQMLAELHVSHTSFYTDDDIEFYMLPAVMRGDLQGNQVEHIGIMGRREGADYVVTAVMDESPAEKAGIQAGDHLLTADGEPFTSAGSFRGKEGRQVVIALHREGEATNRIVRVTPVRQNILRAFLEATEKSARVLHVGGKRLGYIHLWAMAHEAFSEALEQIVLGRLYNTDGLILDLRDGYGGHPWGFGDVFYRPDIAWEQQVPGRAPVVRHTGYNKPMAVLINGGTRSAKESFAYQFKISRRAIMVGSHTAGAFLGAGSFPIGKDGLLELAVLGLRLDGQRLEGVGVTPDVEVAPASAYTDRDSQLARAIQLLLNSTRQRPPARGLLRDVAAY